MTDPRLARVRRIEIQLDDLGRQRHLTEPQRRLVQSLLRERAQLLDAIELDRRQRPLFPEGPEAA